MVDSAAAPEDLHPEMTPIPDEILERDLAIALKVIRPRIQIGGGKKLPDQADRDAAQAAKLLVEHMRLSGVRCFRPLAKPRHCTP